MIVLSVDVLIVLVLICWCVDGSVYWGSAHRCSDVLFCWSSLGEFINNGCCVCVCLSLQNLHFLIRNLITEVNNFSELNFLIWWLGNPCRFVTLCARKNAVPRQDKPAGLTKFARFKPVLYQHQVYVFAMLWNPTRNYLYKCVRWWQFSTSAMISVLLWGKLLFRKASGLELFVLFNRP
jgi:hypothetical protein